MYHYALPLFVVSIIGSSLGLSNNSTITNSSLRDIVLAAANITTRTSDSTTATIENKQASADQKNVDVSTCADVDGICLTVSERRSIQPVKKPGTRTGPVVLCVWYPYPTDKGGWEDPNGLIPVKVLDVGRVYMLHCQYQDSRTSLRGYPALIKYQPAEAIPGDAVNGWEVAAYATNLLRLERPQPAVSPPTEQLVGTETWLAVISQLDYPRKSAQAGDTWATVKAVFSHVTWDFGSYGGLNCTKDATTQWDQTLKEDEQVSSCVKVFTRASEAVTFNAIVTVTWDIYWTSSEHKGWRYFQPYSLSTATPLNIIELQSVIR